GVALLARNQSGPGYFHLTAGPLARPGFMSRMEAHQQMGRVANERHLNAVEAERVAGLIDQIAEPSPNRTIESDRVNVMRLNLALDALP
ncbi:MAG: potassium-transporting ATPase subunit, partial [Verrucomicrobiaceae bacterium]|nr:potassium-transporting ATPase subunit [Verrucomicrobiaceae bacterium]